MITIPDQAKGQAYVQNHPLVGAAVTARYAAINEVYFDELEAMRARIAFFAAHDVGRADAELVSEVTFVAVTERLIHSA